VGKGLQSATRDTTHIRTFKVGLKTYEIAIEAINHTSDVLAGNGGIGHIVGEIPYSRSEDGIGEREERVVPTNVVEFRVYPCLVYETSRVDLVVVRRVTPTTEPGRRIVPDGRVVDVMNVYTEVMGYWNQIKEVYGVDERLRHLWSSPSTAELLCSRTA